jgi:TonB-linked SusC/RagA family outer membrane protein
MKKILFFLFTAMLCSFSIDAISQVRTITGRVVDEKGTAIPSASIVVKGKNTGVAASEDGSFRINAQTGDLLVISSVNFITKEVKVGSASTISISLINESSLSEVVVTALNIKRKADNLSYASQGIKADKLTTTRIQDVNNALAGKISGIQVRSESGAKLGSAATVRLRGAGSLGDVNPLYVIDGTPVSANDINTDDVDDIQVLKGPAATALYGQRAEGGVIMITTKKGKKKAGLGVEVTSTAVIDKVGLLPKYQNQYSGGTLGTPGQEWQTFAWDASMPAEWKALDGKRFHTYFDDASWGPRMDGSEYIPWYAWYPGTQYSYKTAKLTPQPNNVKQFWNGNGAVQFVNNVSLSRSDDNYSFRLSYSNINQKGLIPNSTLLKNYLSTSLSYDVNKHFTAGINLNYANEVINGEFTDDYGNNSSGSFSSWFHRDLDMNILKQFRGYRTPDGIVPSWNLNDGNGINGLPSSNKNAFLRPNYWFDHYTYFDNVSSTTNRSRIVGDINLTYKFNSHFRVAGFIRKNQQTKNNESKVPTVLEISSNDASSSLAYSEKNSGRPIRATYSTRYNYDNEDNFELLMSYNQKFGDFAVDLNAGANDRINESKYLYNTTKGGLVVPDLFALNNSLISPFYYENVRSKKEVRSLYGRGSVNWKDIAILDFSVRNDNSSALAIGQNSYTYPSVGATFILTKYAQKILPAFSFAKLRGSFAQIGSDLDAYVNGTTYTLNSAQWNGNPLTTVPDLLVDPNIKPALSSSYEAGFDFRFLKNRIGLSFTYYTQKNKNQIVKAPITGSSGFSSKLINAGQVDRDGIEISVDATPITTKDFQWNIGLNLAHNNSKIVSLYPGVNVLYGAGGAYASTVGNPGYAAGVWNYVNQPWGQLRGGGILKYNGVPVLDANGFYTPVQNVTFGSVLPDYTGGMTNSFRYKDFNLAFVIDFCKGGKYYSLSDFWGKVSGLYDVTAGVNDKGNPIRTAVANGGGVHVVGVDGTASHNKVDMYVEAGDYYTQFYNHQINENSIFDLTYVKVREISFGYRLPLEKLGKFGSNFQNINISAVCRNPFLIYSANKNIDPSELVGGYGEAGQLPPTRSIGVTLKIGF